MASDLDRFLEHLSTGGLENFRKYYSWYRALVTDNKDPDKRGRVLASIHSIGQSKDIGVWIDPSADYAGPGHGSFWVPEVGDPIWVGFWTGDPGQPHIYMGGWHGKGSSFLPSQLGYGSSGAPTKRGWVTKANHSAVFNDESGKEAIEIKWKGGNSFLTFDSNGDINLQNSTGSVVTISGNTITVKNAVGSSVVVDAATVTLTDAAQSTVKLDGAGSINMQASGNTVVLGPAGIDLTSIGPVTITSPELINLVAPIVNGGVAPNSPVVKFIEFAALFQSHFHLCAVGPTLPPTPAPPLLAACASPSVIVT